jgi:Fic family protein
MSRQSIHKAKKMEVIDRTEIKPGLVKRVRQFFENAPEEELTYEFIVIQFGCTLGTARKVVYSLVETGFLESVHVIRRREKGIAR